VHDIAHPDLTGTLSGRAGAERTLKLQRKSCFILAPNQLDTDALSDEALLAACKGQQQVERSFPFLRDPLFLASLLHLKPQGASRRR
jgi:hypothetical protein